MFEIGEDLRYEVLQRLPILVDLELVGVYDAVDHAKSPVELLRILGGLDLIYGQL